MTLKHRHLNQSLPEIGDDRRVFVRDYSGLRFVVVINSVYFNGKNNTSHHD